MSCSAWCKTSRIADSEWLRTRGGRPHRRSHAWACTAHVRRGSDLKRRWHRCRQYLQCRWWWWLWWVTSCIGCHWQRSGVCVRVHHWRQQWLFCLDLRHARGHLIDAHQHPSLISIVGAVGALAHRPADTHTHDGVGVALSRARGPRAGPRATFDQRALEGFPSGEMLESRHMIVLFCCRLEDSACQESHCCIARGWMGTKVKRG
jgi:hypothetical protein